MLLCAGCNLISGFSDQYKVFYSTLEFFNPSVKIDMLIITSAYQKHRTRHSTKSLDCRIHIGPLGIIIIAHTGTLAHKLNTVFHRLKFLANLYDFIHWNAHFQGYSHRTHNIFIIMLTQKLYILGFKELLFFVFGLINKLVIT